MADDIVTGFKDVAGKPVVPRELPDMLYRVQFGAVGRQQLDGYIGSAEPDVAPNSD